MFISVLVLVCVDEYIWDEHSILRILEMSFLFSEYLRWAGLEAVSAALRWDGFASVRATWKYLDESLYGSTWRSKTIESKETKGSDPQKVGVGILHSRGEKLWFGLVGKKYVWLKVFKWGQRKLQNFFMNRKFMWKKTTLPETLQFSSVRPHLV